VKELIEQIRIENALSLAKNKIFHFNRWVFALLTCSFSF
jgi:hypothetical protein